MRIVRSLVGAGALLSLGCGVITVGPAGRGPELRREDTMPKSASAREECSRYMAEAHAALVKMSARDSAALAAHAHAVAMQEYHICLARAP